MDARENARTTRGQMRVRRMWGGVGIDYRVSVPVVSTSRVGTRVGGGYQRLQERL